MTGRPADSHKMLMEVLYSEHHRAILNYLYRMVGDAARAEDLAQEVFLRAFRALPKLPDAANYRAWLYRIATNAAYDALRRQRLLQWLSLRETDVDDSSSVRPEQVEKAVKENPEAGLIIVTSPTYEGVVSDIKAICDIAHRQKIPVLVDAAHGAHFGFSGFFPPNPVSCGADIVVASLHKTLPALTQCALAHVSGGLIDGNRLASELAVFQTSSPSYVLLSSIDRCLRLLDSGKEALFSEYEKNLEAFNKSISGIGKLRVLCHGADTQNNRGSFFGFDPGKIVMSTRSTNLSGKELAQLLRSKYRIELEMVSADYAVAMSSLCDSRDALALLIGALLDADREAESDVSGDKTLYPPSLPRRLVTAAEAAIIKGERRPIEKAVGMMSLEYIWAYPPGIPFLVPGERIDGSMAAFLRQSADAGLALKSTTGGMPQDIRCAPVPST